MPHQGRNLADLLSLLAVAKDDADEIDLVLVTTEEPKAEFKQRQLLMLKDIKDASDAAGVRLAVRLDDTIHDRPTETNHGWRIDQIGRASGRAKVCKYVKTSVVAVTIK